MKKLLLVSVILFSFTVAFAQPSVSLKNSLSEKKHQVVCSDYSSNGKYLVTGGLEGKVFVWDVAQGTVFKELKGLSKFPLSVKFSPDMKYVVSGGKDSKVTIWNFSSGAIEKTFSGHKDDVTSVAISPDNRYIASACKDKTVKIWEISSGQEVKTLTGHKGEVMAVAYNRDGTKLASGSADGTVREWDTATGQSTQTIKAHDGWVRTVAYSPNGNFIASGGDDYKINIWNAYSYEKQNSILAHSGWVEKLAFSPDGKYLVSGGHDNYLIMIEVNSGKIVFNSEKQSYYVLSVAFNPNGKEFVSSSLYSDKIMVWNTADLAIESNKPKEVQVVEKPKVKPVIEWITENNSQTENLTYKIRYRVKSEYKADNFVLYLNGSKYSTEDNISFSGNQWIGLDKIVYLNDGENSLKLELYYADGIVVSENLTVKYKSQPIAEVIPETVIKKEEQAPKETPPVKIEEEIVKEEITTAKEEIVPSKEEQIPVTVKPTPVKEETVPVKEEKPAEKVDEVQTKSDLFNVSFTNKPNPYRFALIIGNEDYSSYQVGLQKESNVDFAVNDAKAFKEYALKAFGVPQDNILFLTNARAIEMDNELQKLKNIIKALNGKAEVIFYYAGHGFPDEKTKEPYLIPVDVTGTNLRFAIKLNDLYKELAEFPSKRVTVFLDACFSGGARNVGLVSARGVKVKPKENLLNGNLVVFTASSDNQSSHPYRDKNHGLFTYFLLSKLKETQGDISYKELSDYVVEMVGVKSAIINNTEQTPQTNVSPTIDSNWGNWVVK